MATIHDLPTLSLVVKLASIAVHAQEAVSPGGHEFDVQTVESLLADPEVATAMKTLEEAAMLPRRRDA